MKLPLSWVREWIEIDELPSQTAHSLTMAGLEVDGIHSYAKNFDQVVVGEVVAVASHPSADRLKIATVSDGETTHQVVCGAPNCRKGLRTAFAKIGAVLSDEKGASFQIEQTQIRGVISNGMLCSEKELGLGDEHDGIIEFSGHIPAGADVAEIFADDIFEISLTPNLARCASVRGVARELAAIQGKPIKQQKVSKIIESDPAIHQFVSVSIENLESCPYYACRLIQGVKIAPSPDWLKRRLIACDVRPVNNVVDITNLVLFELGHPLHAFDFQKIQGGTLIVRNGLSGEYLKTLDGKGRTLSHEDLLVCDQSGPIALAGVMGGEFTEVSDQTVDVLLEAALFNPIQIRRTSKRHLLSSEAVKRFEKGCDPDSVMTALNRATQLIQEIAGGNVAAGVVEEGSASVEPLQLTCRMSRVNALLGTQLSLSEVEDIFKRLDMDVCLDGEDVFLLKIPKYRLDITQEVDLIEEVARIVGFDHLPRSLPRYVSPPLKHAPMYVFEQEIRQRLVSFGLQEFLTCDLIGPKAMDHLKESLMEDTACIHVLNPTSIEQSILRTSLLPGLLQVIKHNQDHQNIHISGFELGKIHFKQEEQYKEQLMCAFVFSGKTGPDHFSKNEREWDFLDLKGVVEDFLESVHVGPPRFEPSSRPAFHPSRQAAICAHSLQVGIMGEVHPAIRRLFDLDHRIFYAEIDVHDLMKIKEGQAAIRPLSLYPASTRDLTLTVDEKVAVQDFFDVIEKENVSLLESVQLIDIYQGRQAGVGKKNLTFHFVYRSAEQTVSQQAVDLAHAAISSALDIFKDTVV